MDLLVFGIASGSQFSQNQAQMSLINLFSRLPHILAIIGNHHMSMSLTFCCLPPCLFFYIIPYYRSGSKPTLIRTKSCAPLKSLQMERKLALWTLRC